MIPTEMQFEPMLDRLRKEGTESPTIEGKESLTLDTEGDRAYFIRHAVALANNVEPSYLIIGVKNRTWDPVGLREGSPLRNADETQQRMNQTLANRLDPNLSVRYRTYEIDGTVYGLVAFEGTRAPYIIAIEDREYGGDRTQAAPSYIYRGAVYVRRGANSVTANRQSEILDVIRKSQVLGLDGDQPDEFLSTYNYVDPEAESFGHHPLTDDLVEIHHSSKCQKRDVLPAESWISFVFCPQDTRARVETTELKNELKPDQRIGRGSEWFRGIPRPFLDMLYRPTATPHQYLSKYSPTRQDTGSGITHFLRIRPSGHIEVACTEPLFFVRDTVRCFSFVCLVGYLWQMMYFAQALYRHCSYYGIVTVLMNVISTRDSLLVDYARSKSGGWASPFSPLYTAPICQDQNIQVQRAAVLADSSDDEIESVVREMARDLGTYYQQDQPRCFDIHTDEFPYRQYQSYCGI